MARNYGNIAVAIWRDPDFTALSVNAQRTYMLLITQHDISSVGTLAITLRRWSRMASDASQECLSDGLKELEAARFIVIDWEGEEILVRTFVKWDGGHTNPKRISSILSAAAAVTSPIIGPVMSTELDSLGLDHVKSYPQVDSHSIADRMPTDPPRVVVTTEVSPSQPTTRNPQSASHSPRPKADESASAGKPAQPTRVPEPFQITEDMRGWAAESTPGLDVDWYTGAFVDFWRGKSGRNGTKLDWVATWRNWMRSEHGKPHARRMNGHGPPAQRSTAEIRANQAWDIAQQIRAEEEAATMNHRQIGPAR